MFLSHCKPSLSSSICKGGVAPVCFRYRIVAVSEDGTTGTEYMSSGGYRVSGILRKSSLYPNWWSDYGYSLEITGNTMNFYPNSLPIYSMTYPEDYRLKIMFSKTFSDIPPCDTYYYDFYKDSKVLFPYNNSNVIFDKTREIVLNEVYNGMWLLYPDGSYVKTYNPAQIYKVLIRPVCDETCITAYDYGNVFNGNPPASVNVSVSGSTNIGDDNTCHCDNQNGSYTFTRLGVRAYYHILDEFQSMDPFNNFGVITVPLYPYNIVSLGWGQLSFMKSDGPIDDYYYADFHVSSGCPSIPTAQGYRFGDLGASYHQINEPLDNSGTYGLTVGYLSYCYPEYYIHCVYGCEGGSVTASW